MAAFNAEMAPFRPLGRWEFASMVGARGSWEEAARRGGCEEGRGRQDGRASISSCRASLAKPLAEHTHCE